MAPKDLSSVVVIGGWLGCNPKHLKPYERMYNAMGFDVICVVASPLCVIDATLSLQNVAIANHLPTSTNDLFRALSAKKDTKMQDLAWKVLGNIHDSRANAFLYHSFSNGGCFLWESMCRILLLKDDKNCSLQISAFLEGLHQKCKGVIFDSCPAWFGSELGTPSKLSQALQYCSKEERRGVHSVYGARIHYTDEDTLNRNLEYFANLTKSPFDIPQLYIYCKNDDLARFEYISKIIESRRLTQKRPVFEQVWDRSIHCSHLREHEEDYQKTVKAFVQQLNAWGKARL